MSAIATQIWQEKYRHPNDQTVSDTWARVARGLAAAEKPELRDIWAGQFYDAFKDFEALPAGRIIAGAGTDRLVTLINCYVMGTIPDSMKGIMSSLGESAISMQMGAGIGNDFSTLRPNGALIKSLGSTASGPLPFMDMWNSMCRSIMSAGTRRGAMMGTLRCDHPDIEAFIDAKRSGSFKMFNLSVLITGEFMEAVKFGHAWQLVFDGQVYRTVDARTLWDKIMRATYDVADPGVIFIDRINDRNPLRYAETISCTNPCGEQPLPPYGSCCLGSINLAKLVKKPFTTEASVDWVRLQHLVYIMVRALDNVLDVTAYPLEAQRVEAQRKRRIGLGITGLADMLAMCGIPYAEGEHLSRDVARCVNDAAIEASVKLGEEKGSFPLFDSEHYRSKHRRNSHVTSIAPTGTISLFAGNPSSGIEPIFDHTAKRKILQPDNTWLEVDVTDYAWGLWERTHLTEEVQRLWEKNRVWDTAAKLRPEDHLKILAAVTPFVDSSVSKTINCPVDIPFEEFKSVYEQAYKLGCKSCTTYRPNEVTGSILSSDSMSLRPKDNVVELTKPLTRPDVLGGYTYRLKPQGTDHALFVTITNIERDGRLSPFEMFISTKDMRHLSWTTALTRMVSAIFRKGGDVSFIVEELVAIYDPSGGYWEGQEYVPSIVAGIGRIISRHLATLGTAPQSQGETTLECSQCHDGIMRKREGCWYCDKCTNAKCG